MQVDVPMVYSASTAAMTSAGSSSAPVLATPDALSPAGACIHGVVSTGAGYADCNRARPAAKPKRKKDSLGGCDHSSAECFIRGQFPKLLSGVDQEHESGTLDVTWGKNYETKSTWEGSILGTLMASPPSASSATSPGPFAGRRFADLLGKGYGNYDVVRTTLCSRS